ncbi:MAG: glycosyltransferase family 39 protein [Chloroflexota bacterium]|nr:MAG: glycosyltransferase family 39 protein [Chloroflexota bacterium]
MKLISRGFTLGHQNTKRTVFAFVLLAFVLRLGTMLALETYSFPTEKARVGFEMGWIASEIAAGSGFKLGGAPTAWMAPLYPFILSLIYRIFAYSSLSSTIATLVLQSFISSLVVIPLYLVGKRLFSWQVGLLAAGLWIVHPASIHTAVLAIWSTNITAFGIMMIILLAIKVHDNPDQTLFALALGLVVGLTALSDPVILIPMPFIALWIFWRSGDQKVRVLKQITIVALLALLTVVPWTIRNYRAFERIVPIKATLGVNLWLGNHREDINQPSAGLNTLEAVYSEDDLAYLASLNEVERDRVVFGRALEFIRANPAIFVKYTLYRIFLFWRVTVADTGVLLDRALLTLPLLMGLGLLLSWHHWRDTSWLLLLFITFPVVYYLTHSGYPRFRFPIEGPMLIMMAYAIQELFQLSTRIRPFSPAGRLLKVRYRRNLEE